MLRRTLSRLSILSALALSGLSAGCVDAPELRDLGDPALEDADYPALVPVDRLLGPTRGDTEADARTAAALEARMAGLKARASRLQASGIDEATRKRLDAGVQTD